MSGAIALRPVTAADEPFLEQVYAGTRADELAVVPWSDEQKRDFLHFQFIAQSTDYAARFPDGRFDVILVEGAAAGRLYVHRTTEVVHIIDIALLPEHRNSGVGSQLLNALMSEGQPVTIHVERTNPAMRLYLRLGFEVTSDDGGLYVLMQAQPKTAS